MGIRASMLIETRDARVWFHVLVLRVQRLVTHLTPLPNFRPSREWKNSCMSNRVFHERVHARIRLVAVLVAGIGALTWPGRAEAHVKPSPATIRPGAIATVSFTIPHGCSESPTIGVAIKLPAGVVDAKATAPKGWTVTIRNSIATFRGGSLPAKTPGKFAITFTAPTSEGTLLFPTVQTCTVGKTSWTEPTPADGAEPDYPIPTVLVASSASKSTKTTKRHS